MLKEGVELADSATLENVGPRTGQQFGIREDDQPSKSNNSSM